MGKVEKRLAKRTVKTYGNRNTLHRRMLSRHPAFPDFVTGTTTGEGTHFHCRVCKRDVAMKAQGSGEFGRNFRSDAHWFKDVTYRVHMGVQVLNRRWNCQQVNWQIISLDHFVILAGSIRSLKIYCLSIQKRSQTCPT